MKLSIKAGSTSQSIQIFIQDSSSTVGAGLSGLVYNTASLAAYYNFNGANGTATAITLATLAAVNSAWSSGGFKEIQATNMKGLYRLDLPDAVLATAKGRSVVVYLYGATNMAPVILEIELVGWDNQTVVTFAGATAVGAYVGNATAALGVDAFGRVDVGYLRGLLQTQRDLGLNVLISSGTATGQLDVTSGVIKSNVTQFSGSGGALDLSAVPTVNDTWNNVFSWLYMLARNKITQTATTQIVKKDDGTTTLGTSTVSDDGTTFTRGKFV